MVDEIACELVRYSDIRHYNPLVGDIIVKHGWVFRTKWFGVINFITKERVMQIITESSPRMLVTTMPEQLKKTTFEMHLSKITQSFPGSYSIMQIDLKSKVPIWYI